MLIVQTGPARVRIGHHAFRRLPPGIQGALQLADAVDGVGHPRVLVASGLRTAVQPDDLHVLKQVATAGLRAAPQDLQEIGCRMAPVRLVNDLARGSVLRILVRLVHGDGQIELPQHVDGQSRFVGGEHGLDAEEIHAALGQRRTHALVGVPRDVVRDAELRIAAVGLDGARQRTDGTGQVDVPPTALDGGPGMFHGQTDQPIGFRGVLAGHFEMGK